MENGEKIRMIRDIAGLQSDMESVKKQVSNHIPTSIRELDASNKIEHKELRSEIGTIKLKIARWSGSIIVILGVVQYLINKFG
jgi:hypothetical protein